VASTGKKEELKIRRPKIADAPQIAALTGQLGYPATAAEMRKRLLGIKTATQHAVFVADSPEDGVIGCRRAAQPGSGRAVAGRRGRLGAQTRLQEHVGPVECSSRSRAQVLRTKRLRALQNAEIVPQTAVTPAIPDPLLLSVNHRMRSSGNIYRIAI
jgi:hypothetical protein